MRHSNGRHATIRDRTRRLVGCLVIGLAAAGLSSASATAGEAFTINVVDFAYAPATLTVHVGDTVTWTNGDSIDHTATTQPGAPVAFNGPLPPGGSFSVTFSQAGSYDYYCIPHPMMEGAIVVLPVATPAPAPTSGQNPIPDAAMDQPGSDPPPSALGAALLVLAGLLGLGTLRFCAARP